MRCLYFLYYKSFGHERLELEKEMEMELEISWNWAEMSQTQKVNFSISDLCLLVFIKSVSACIECVAVKIVSFSMSEICCGQNGHFKKHVCKLLWSK
jgi:hypothetical protein